MQATIHSVSTRRIYSALLPGVVTSSRAARIDSTARHGPGDPRGRAGRGGAAGSVGFSSGESGADQVEDVGVLQGGGVADGAVFGDVAQEAAHDFAGSGFGEFGDDEDAFGFGDGSDLVGHM